MMPDHDTGEAPATAAFRGPPSVPVGYKSPPVAHQFKPGVSGNPRGRPKGSKDKLRIFERVMGQLHAVVEDGRTVQRSTLELILIALRNKAFTGNTAAYKEFARLEALYNPPAQKPAGVLVVPGRLTKEAWVRAFASAMSEE